MILSRPLFIGMGLAFTAGFVDTVGFIGLFGLFTAHVTGNFVMIGAALADHRGGIIVKLLALPVFIVAVAATRLWVMARERGGKTFQIPLLVTQMILLAGFMGAAVAASPITDAVAPLAVVASFLGVAAMGIQNAAARLAFTTLAPTTVMTGNVTQAVIDSVDLIFHGSEQPKAEIKARFHKLWPPVLAFALGAVLGALGFITGGFLSLAAPILVLGALAIALRPGAAITKDV